MVPSASLTGVEAGHDEAGVRGELELVDAGDDFIAQLGVEVDAVGFEELAGGGVVAFGLDALNLGEEAGHAFAEGPGVGHDEVGLAVAGALFDGLEFSMSQWTTIWRFRMWSSSSWLAFADAAELGRTLLV